ncbi:MAG: DUF3795 domain-containing protein [Candidatus Hermodarchaeota archaeon]
MIEKKIASACGLYCGTCEYFGEDCQGCGNIQGKPFWTEKMEDNNCPLYDCCVNKNKLEHCGLCNDLPCDLFKSFNDPSLTPEEAKKSVASRQNELLRRKEIGTEEWINLKKNK